MIEELIAKRTSCRAYKTDPVPQEHLDRIIEAARLAPSSCNKQPWRFAVVRKPELRSAIIDEGFRAGIPMKWALNAPVLIVIGQERSFITHRLAVSLTGIDYAEMDIGIAGEHMVLAATELGLGTCWIGWIKSKAVADLVGWHVGIKPCAIITVGYPAEQTSARSPRKQTSEIVTWL